MDDRLVLEDVEPGAGDRAGLERLTSAASSTTGPRVVLTRNARGFIASRWGADQVPRLLGERAVERDHVGGRQQLLEGQERRAPARPRLSGPARRRPL